MLQSVLLSQQYTVLYLHACCCTCTVAVLTWKKISAPHEGLPVDEADGIHVHLFQSRLAVPEVHRSLQHFRRHVTDGAHLDSRTEQV